MAGMRPAALDLGRSMATFPATQEERRMTAMPPIEAADVDGVPTTVDDPAAYLAPTWYMDFDNPVVRDFAASRSDGGADDRDKAVKLFYAIRDEFLYTPYDVSLDRRDYKASALIGRGWGWCVQKSLAMAACCRFLGIPARLGYADVRNHLTTPRLHEQMGTDLFSYHGYADLWLEGRWVKATPVFNLTLCEKFGVKAQEFDGRADALFQEYDQAGRRHMEYVNDRGIYTDLPFAEIMNDFAVRYPKYQTEMWADADPGAFARDAEREGRPD
jgi:transglutaminase-like putative cysteine protease